MLIILKHSNVIVFQVNQNEEKEHFECIHHNYEMVPNFLNKQNKINSYKSK